MSCAHHYTILYVYMPWLISIVDMLLFVTCLLAQCSHYCKLEQQEEVVCFSTIFSPAVTLCPVLALWGQRMLERACVTGRELQEADHALWVLLMVAKMAASLSLIL